MSKRIIFCADGTWNGPYEEEGTAHIGDPTNVYKLFLRLDGTFSPDSLRAADEQEKQLNSNGAVEQIAKYVHGVGDSRNYLNKVMGGMFGAGVITRIVRGYTFISRNYDRNDKIYIIGFSRGAYTARALTGMIASQGLLAAHMTDDTEQAYRSGAEAWYRYRKATITDPLKLAHLAEIASNLPAFLSSGSLQARDLTTVNRIECVAVWDTVGALGFPEYIGKGKRVDAFKFTDTTLSPKVAKGLHAISRDERRNDFIPTLWDPGENVRQLIFAGAHADVGGGYPITNDESGLSDYCLQWMEEELTSCGVLFSQSPQYTIVPNHLGPAHKPWAHEPWNLPGILLGSRSLAGIPEDKSILLRKAATVLSDIGEIPGPYL